MCLWVLQRCGGGTVHDKSSQLFSFILGVDHSGDGALVDWIFTLEFKKIFFLKSQNNVSKRFPVRILL